MTVSKGGSFYSHNCYTTLEISYSIHTFASAIQISGDDKRLLRTWLYCYDQFSLRLPPADLGSVRYSAFAKCTIDCYIFSIRTLIRRDKSSVADSG
jgi:hypothetical protein